MITGASKSAGGDADIEVGTNDLTEALTSNTQVDVGTSSFTLNQCMNYTGWTLNVVDSVIVAAFYAILSSESDMEIDNSLATGWYSFSSFSLNFPMSMLFTYYLVDEIREFKRACKESDGRFFLALLLGFGLTFAALIPTYAIGNDTVEDSGFIQKYLTAEVAEGLVFIFMWNILCTRLVGSKNLIASLINFLTRGKISEMDRTLAFLKSDLQRLPFDSSVDPEQSSESIIKSAYKAMPVYNMLERFQSKQPICFRLFSIPFTMLAWNTMVLWLGKSEAGAQQAADFFHWNKDTLQSLVIPGMLASLLFYMNSAMSFIPNNMKFYHLILHRVPGLNSLLSNRKSMIFAASIVSIHIVSYASGQAMGNEGQKLFDSLYKDGSPKRTKAYLDSLAGQWLSPHALIATWEKIADWFPLSSINIVAGNVVNGQAATNLIVKLCDLSKNSGYVEKILGKLMSELKTMSQESQKDMLELIQQLHQGLSTSADVKNDKTEYPDTLYNRESKSFDINDDLAVSL
jgi:hypothetical protein